MVHLPETVSASSFLDLSDSCNALGIACSGWKAVDRDELLNPENRVDETTLLELWNEMDRHSKIPHFGLLVGQQINPSAKGLLASWVSQCGTLKEAFDVFQKNTPLMNPSEKWGIEQKNGTITLTFTLQKEKGYPPAAIERSMSALLTWSHALTGQQLSLIAAKFQFKQPKYVSKYVPVFGDKLIFDSENNELVFIAEFLDLPIKSANNFLKQVMQTKANSALKKLGSNVPLSEKVKDLILVNLPHQKATIEVLSNELFMSRQSIYRKLKEEGTDFKTLLNEVRKTLAVNLLTADSSNMTTISISLGFKELGSFYKAFRRWYGVSPRDYSSKL